MKKTAVLFPGQGAQVPGMARDFYEQFPASRQVFEEASDTLGYSMERSIFEGVDLDLTEHTQPGILTASRAIVQGMGLEEAQAAAGLSLGEYSALVFAGSFSFHDALLLVQQRGRFMQEAVPAGVGGMTAVLKLDRGSITRILGELDQPVWIANVNCPGQIVVSGELESLAAFKEMAMEAGAKACVDLPLSAPFHTPMLEPASRRLQEVLMGVSVHAPQIPVVFNVTAGVESDPDTIRALLTRQVMSPVLFEDSLHTLVGLGVERMIEIGPGSTLKSFVKKTLKDVEIISVSDVESWKKAGL